MDTLKDETGTMTAGDLLRLHSDGCRHELVHGHLVRDLPAGSRHGAIVQRLARRLGEWVERAGAGVVFAAETGFRLRSDPETVRAPDVSFIAASRIPADGLPDGFWDGPPDLAVEVLSSDDGMVDVLDKVRDYLEAGVGCVWVVAPKSHTVAVYRSLQEVCVRAEGQALLGEGPLDGFRCPVGELFA